MEVLPRPGVDSNQVVLRGSVPCSARSRSDPLRLWLRLAALLPLSMAVNWGARSVRPAMTGIE
ncbi:hypothetical protein DMB66_55030 [Actinoplanes sp. ATCC 53533]|nr:hypothetical protein DMB66_55030 [Actinoplanes sp. ATCC 53533]